MCFFRVAGQVAQYMFIFKLKYGFFTTYDETIFLKQVQRPGGTWKLCYSDPIKRKEGIAPGGPPVSTRKPAQPEFLSDNACFTYATLRMGNNYLVNNDTPFSKWFSVDATAKSEIASPHQGSPGGRVLTTEIANRRRPTTNPSQGRSGYPHQDSSPTRQPRTLFPRSERQRSQDSRGLRNPYAFGNSPSPSPEPRMPQDTRPSQNPPAFQSSLGSEQEPIVVTVDRKGKEGTCRFLDRNITMKLSDLKIDSNGKRYLQKDGVKYPVTLKKEKK
jgi:hypothetical protein